MMFRDRRRTFSRACMWFIASMCASDLSIGTASLAQEPGGAVSTFHAPAGPRSSTSSTSGVALTLDELARQPGRKGTRISYRLRTSGFPLDKRFTMKQSSLSQPKPVTLLTGLQADESGSLRTGILNNIAIDMAKFALTVEDYNKAEALMVEIISEDGSVHAADKVYPFPIEASDGACQLWAELIDKNRKMFAIVGRGFGPNTDVATVSVEDNGTDRIEKSERVGLDDLFVAVVTHKRAGGTSTFSADGPACRVRLSYAFGRQANGPL